jgi:hypothetical protein
LFSWAIIERVAVIHGKRKRKVCGCACIVAKGINANSNPKIREYLRFLGRCGDLCINLYTTTRIHRYKVNVNKIDKEETINCVVSDLDSNLSRRQTELFSPENCIVVGGFMTSEIPDVDEV